MIKLKTLLTETIYGNQAIVYHRTKVEDLANKIYDTGFIPGDGDFYGKGMYATYELASQEKTHMREYGDIIVKFAVDLTGFFFFDWGEFIKTPLYTQKLQKSTSDTFIQDQIAFYKIKADRNWYIDEVYRYSSDIAVNLYLESDLSVKVAGLVFTGETDGKVLLCYDTKRLRPVAYKMHGDSTFTKADDRPKDFLRKTMVSSTGLTTARWLRHLGCRFTENSDGTYDVLHAMSLIYSKTIMVKGIRNVKGDFSVAGQNFRSLKNFPTGKIGGNIDLSFNKLTTLKGCPDVSGPNRKLIADDNELVSLEGCPTSIAMLSVRHNRLTSLKGITANELYSIEARFNRLTSLQGSPRKVQELYVSDNRLTSLQGCPEEIDLLNFSRNEVSSLYHCPKRMKNLICSGNRLTSLEGGPEIIEDHLNCEANPLRTLEGFPKEIGGNLYHSSKFTEDQIRAVCNVKGQIINTWP
jgi:hypothetical protein